ncbi:KpsF/GutQ family sugar-phosphate isomerase [Raoultella planticola]|uniref:KpsF/GutQ family sugar-phosphate isomerase n=1 Tax=Raoultella planticola TaxID=575 RepID=UPI001BD67E61|nr:KpsF/GutQ family sugar-phosphate isomerase [Raoultella planticola]MCS7492047.1 KpsF/GutQ family sugar-phosphate isomerase [Raoultella planticola]MDC3910037.1 KpsF/GutQ family sugar-phosphate isomerase [Raoultella planticola]
MNNKTRNTSEIINRGRNVLHEEAKAIISATSNINDNFAKAINIILNAPGKVVLSAMGKPGYIAHKISATLASTGTPSFYLHPAEALHGDLGRVSREDVVILISNSGETTEVINMLPALKRTGVPIIAICGAPDSPLAKYSDVVISSQVEHECCPLDLAPTTSTTLALAIGDALAVTLMQERNFSKEEFALYHPGGSLGRRRLLTVGKAMRSGEKACLIGRESTILDALFIMTRYLSGAALIVNGRNELEGIITDGDIRRYIMYNNLFLQTPVRELMNPFATCIGQHQLIDEAIRIMEQHQPAPITVLPVINDDKQVVGLLHLTDLLRIFPPEK